MRVTLNTQSRIAHKVNYLLGYYRLSKIIKIGNIDSDYLLYTIKFSNYLN